MIRLLIISDTHRSLRFAENAIKNIIDITAVIHLGDFAADAESLNRKFPHIEFISVPGNCDGFTPYKTEQMVEFGGKKIVLCHGHTHGVKSGHENYALYVREIGADIALFGHTHIPLNCSYNGVLMFNPGSAGACVQPSFGIIEIEEGKVSACIIDTPY